MEQTKSKTDIGPRSKDPSHAMAVRGVTLRFDGAQALHRSEDHQAHRSSPLRRAERQIWGCQNGVSRLIHPGAAGRSALLVGGFPQGRTRCVRYGKDPCFKAQSTFGGSSFGRRMCSIADERVVMTCRSRVSLLICACLAPRRTCPIDPGVLSRFHHQVKAAQSPGYEWCRACDDQWKWHRVTRHQPAPGSGGMRAVGEIEEPGYSSSPHSRSPSSSVGPTVLFSSCRYCGRLSHHAKVIRPSGPADGACFHSNPAGTLRGTRQERRNECSTAGAGASGNGAGLRNHTTPRQARLMGSAAEMGKETEGKKKPGDSNQPTSRRRLGVRRRTTWKEGNLRDRRPAPILVPCPAPFARHGNPSRRMAPHFKRHAHVPLVEC